MSRVTDQYHEAQNYLAGGVSASTRVNRAVGHPMLFDRGRGCRLWDLDGKEYIDLCCSHGATLLGHGDPAVRRAVEAALARGAACSYENETQTELGRLLWADRAFQLAVTATLQESHRPRVRSPSDPAADPAAGGDSSSDSPARR